MKRFSTAVRITYKPVCKLKLFISNPIEKFINLGNIRRSLVFLLKPVRSILVNLESQHSRDVCPPRTLLKPRKGCEPFNYLPRLRVWWWTWPDSNRLPRPCKGRVLPGELQAHIMANRSGGGGGKNLPAEISLWLPTCVWRIDSHMVGQEGIAPTRARKRRFYRPDRLL